MAISRTSDRVKCIGCGFLSRRAISPQLGGGEHFEFLTGDRATGGGNTPTTPETEQYVADCFLNKEDFFHEIGLVLFIGRADYLQGSEMANRVLDVIEKDRKCVGWYQWHPGSTPKEHMDRLLLEQQEQDRREHREAMTALVTSSQDAQKAVIDGIKEVLTETRQIFSEIQPIIEGFNEILKNLVPIVDDLRTITSAMKTTTDELKTTVDSMKVTVTTMEQSSTRMGRYTIGFSLAAILLTVLGVITGAVQIWLAYLAMTNSALPVITPIN